MWWMLLVACSRTDLRGTTGSQEMDANQTVMDIRQDASCQRYCDVGTSTEELRNAKRRDAGKWTADATGRPCHGPCAILSDETSRCV